MKHSKLVLFLAVSLSIVNAILISGCTKKPETPIKGETITVINNTEKTQIVSVIVEGGKTVSLKLHPNESVDYVPDSLPTMKEEEMPELPKDTSKVRL